MNSNLEQLNQSLANGEVPDCLNFTLQKPETVDWDKLQYNNLYKSYQYQASKFPRGFESIPGFTQIIQNIADNAKSPLELYNERNAIFEHLSDSPSIDRCGCDSNEQ